MNENINLCEILKDCPKGIKLYSSLFGEVEFQEIKEKTNYPIFVFVPSYNEHYNEKLCAKMYFTSDGK